MLNVVLLNKLLCNGLSQSEDSAEGPPSIQKNTGKLSHK